MKKIVKEFVLAILAGAMIGVGGCVYLSVENKIVGSLLFTVGLYTIVLNGLFLYTGKVGYLVNEKASYLITLLTTWLGNLVGTFAAARLMCISRIGWIKTDGIVDAAYASSMAKISQSPLSAFVLAIFCGILMYVGVDGYKDTKNPIILFACVSVFILCGFEHCVANMFYFSLGSAWSAAAFGYIIIMTLGNSVGGMLIPLAKKLK